MNDKDPPLTGAVPLSNGASDPPATRRPGEVANENQDAPASTLVARMAQVEAPKQPFDVRTETKTGGNRWLIVCALWTPLLFTLAITSQTLRAFGYQVLTATDGAEAVAAYAEHREGIAVVLTDMSMPIMDGAAVIRALSKINPAIKIIAASGLNANGEVAKVSGTAVKHFLTKPYTAGTLLKVMRTTLDDL